MEEEKKQPNINELAEELAACKKLCDEYLAGWQRQKADFLNFQKEQGELAKRIKDQTTSDCVRDILPILDNLELALSHIPRAGEGDEWAKGVENIVSQFRNFLRSVGVEEIPAQGAQYNPEFHEAVEMIEKEGGSSGAISEVIQKGYTMHGALIRPAKVKVVK